MQRKHANIFGISSRFATFLSVAVFAAALLSAFTVYAAASFNTDPLDFETLRSSNHTRFPNSTTNWALTTDADAGDVVSLTIYYHNTSNEDATNVRASISVPTTAGTSIVSSGTLSADNAPIVIGQTTINISSSQTLTYIPGSTLWYPNQSLSPVQFPFGQTGDEFVSGGVNIGTIAPGNEVNSFATQGSIVARFQVSNGGGQVTPDPTVDVKANNSDGPITLSQNENLDIAWSSTFTTFCSFAEPVNSGVEAGGVMSLSPEHPFYPTNTAVTYTITCDNGAGKTVTDSVTVNPYVNPVSGTLDIIANGSQGPVTLGQGQSLTLDWTSNNVSSCILSIQAVSVIGPVASNGQAGPIDPSSPFYPPAGGSYTYVIACADAQNNAVTDTVMAPALPTIPAAPTLTAATGSQCGGQTALSWNSIATATSYKVFRGGVQIATTTTPVFTDTNLTPNTSYTYTVVASNAAGDSAHSNQVTAISSNVCQQGSSSVDITVNGVQGPYTLSPNENFTLNWTSSNVSSCTLATLLGSQLGPVLTNGSAGPFDVNNSQYPAQGTSQTFVITCQGSQGQVSDTVTVIRPFSGQTPVAPTLTAVTSILCGGSINLSWNAVSNATSYSIFRGGVQIASGVTGLSYVDSNLTPGANYSYTVRAVNSVGPSPDSNMVTVAASAACVAAPSAPLLSAATGSQCGGQITLSWTAVSNTSFYTIFRGGVQIATSTATTFTDTVIPGTQHLYTVKASNAFGDSFDSNAVQVTASAACANPLPTVTITANPSTITQGQNSTLTWISTNANVCSAPWTIATSTSGIFSVSPASTTVYSIDCGNGTATSTASTTVTVTPVGGGGGQNNPTVTLSANPSTITQGQNSTLSWTSTNSTFCSATWTTATSTSGSFVVTPSSTTNYSIDCGNGTATSTATTTVTVNAQGGGNGGGGSSGGSGGGSSSSGGRSGGSRGVPTLVLGATTSCDYLKDYLKIDWVNDRIEVIKLQVFLRELEGFKNLEITGVFDQATYDAVSIFQERYIGDILTPWGHTEHTGFVYILTKKKVNEIVCQRAFPVNEQQAEEIANFKTFLEGLKNAGVPGGDIPGVVTNGNGTDILSENGKDFIAGEDVKNNVIVLQGKDTAIGKARAVAAAIFAGPKGWDESVNAGVIFIAILLAIYLFVRALGEKMSQKLTLTPEGVRLRKFVFAIAALLVAVVVALLFLYYVIVLPLLILIVLISGYVLVMTVKNKRKNAVLGLIEPQTAEDVVILGAEPEDFEDMEEESKIIDLTVPEDTDSK